MTLTREGCCALGYSCCPECSVGSVGQPRGKEEQMLKHGYPAYTTSCAWLCSSDQLLKQLCTEALKEGWTKFKVKVGADLKDNIHRFRFIQKMIGPDKIMMNITFCYCRNAFDFYFPYPQMLDVTELAEFKPLWTEEPTSPDDILGHATIAKALALLGIGVATGEHCQKRVIFKQLLQAKALTYLQIDSCRLGSVNENLSVLLMAKNFCLPWCWGNWPCELVQHLKVFDYISVSGTPLFVFFSRMCEFVDHLHKHFKYPTVIKNASYMPPQDAGYPTEMKENSARNYQFPEGEVWQEHLSSQKAQQH
uniref:Enolase superfamily member 1 n=1 Tax=Apteryx owenii TaxID=8824 RepID=A0A8B9P3D8_APTOW